MSQFSDAEEDDDDHFVAAMREKLSASKVDRESVRVPDYGSDDDLHYDEDYYCMEDELRGERSRTFASTASISTSTVNKRINVSHKTMNSVSKMEGLEASKGSKHTGRDDRATSEGVLDPRTRLMLFKLLSNGSLSKIDGCLSTGKEANVYYAEGRGKELEPLAIKIYKTSILVFKDRERYVSGEHRYRKGYAKSNPRKMVTMWAEVRMQHDNVSALSLELHSRNHFLHVAALFSKSLTHFRNNTLCKLLLPARAERVQKLQQNLPGRHTYP